MRTDRLLTIRQTLPRLVSLLPQLRPTWHVESAADIDAAFVERHEIAAVLWDVDGTIMAYHGTDVAPEFSHLRVLFREGPGRHAILSNCDERRFGTLGDIFPEVPILRGYVTDEGMVFRQRHQGRDTLREGDVHALLTNGGRQLRKPSGDLVRYGMEVLEVEDPAAMLMVGDQYFTDIASANLAGARSAKVPTFRPESFPSSLRASQRFERVLYRVATTLGVSSR